MVGRGMVGGVAGDPWEWESSDAPIPGQGETLVTVHGHMASPLYNTQPGHQRMRRKKRAPWREGGGRRGGAIFSPRGTQGKPPATRLIH